MKKQPTKKTSVGTKKNAASSSSKGNSKAWMIGGVAVLLLGLGTAYYYYRKRKKEEDETGGTPEIVAANSTMKSTLRPVNTFQPITPTRAKFRCNSSTYPLQYGTCNTDVKTLQKYLKAKGEYLGSSGSNRDGVDGQFGNLTLKAAKKRLGKSSFSQSDMLGLRTTPKMVKL